MNSHKHKSEQAAVLAIADTWRQESPSLVKARTQLWRAVWENLRTDIPAPYGGWHRVPKILLEESADTEVRAFQSHFLQLQKLWLRGALSEAELRDGFREHRNLADAILRRDGARKHEARLERLRSAALQSS